MCLLVSSPQNALLPAGLRQKDHTTKTATGSFNREGLLKYLEKEAMEYKDREDVVPFTGERKGVCLSTESLSNMNIYYFKTFYWLKIKTEKVEEEQSLVDW